MDHGPLAADHERLAALEEIDDDLGERLRPIGADGVAGRLRQGRWVRVEGAGHTVQGDNPAGLLVSLREFLDLTG